MLIEGEGGKDRKGKEEDHSKRRSGQCEGYLDHPDLPCRPFFVIHHLQMLNPIKRDQRGYENNKGKKGKGCMSKGVSG